MKKELFEELIVVKRSGQRVSFNGTKIAVAIKHAFDSVNQFNEKEINKVYEDVLLYIENNYAGRKTINVEDIQDIIENVLKQNKQFKVYKSFNDYRLKRAASRKAFGIKQEHKFVKAIEKIANKNSAEDNNVKPIKALLDYGKTISSEFAKAYILDNKYVRAHEEGSIYIHNLDYYALGFFEGTHLKYNNLTVSDDCFLQLIRYLIDCKKEINGEISISRIDFILVPIILKIYKILFNQKLIEYLNLAGYDNYINYRKLEEIINKTNTIKFNNNLFDEFILNDNVKEVFIKAYKDSIEFTSLEITKNFKSLLWFLNENKEFNSKYSISFGTNMNEEGILINNSLLEVVDKLNYLKNIALIYKVTNKRNENIFNKVSKLISKNKNISLSFINSSFNKNKYSEVEYFGDGKRIFENINGLEKESIGRMIIASSTINISRISLKNNLLKDFYIELDETLELIKNELLFTFDIISNKNKENYELIFNNNILDDEKLENNQKIRKVIKNGVLNIELAGLKECISYLENDLLKQKNLLIDILKHIDNKVNKFIVETKLNFIVSETTNELILKDLIALDKSIYGIIKNVTDKEHYETINSLFNYKENIEEDLKFMAIYQKYLTGGCILEIILSKNSNDKKISELIEDLNNYDVGFVKIKLRNTGVKDDS